MHPKKIVERFLEGWVSLGISFALESEGCGDAGNAVSSCPFVGSLLRKPQRHSLRVFVYVDPDCAGFWFRLDSV